MNLQSVTTSTEFNFYHQRHCETFRATLVVYKFIEDDISSIILHLFNIIFLKYNFTMRTIPSYVFVSRLIPRRERWRSSLLSSIQSIGWENLKIYSNSSQIFTRIDYVWTILLPQFSINEIHWESRTNSQMSEHEIRYNSESPVARWGTCSIFNFSQVTFHLLFVAVL